MWVQVGPLIERTTLSNTTGFFYAVTGQEVYADVAKRISGSPGGRRKASLPDYRSKSTYSSFAVVSLYYNA